MAPKWGTSLKTPTDRFSSCLLMMVQLLSSQTDTLLSWLPWQHAWSPTGMPAPSQLFRCCLYLCAHRLLMALLLPSILSDVQIDEAGRLFVCFACRCSCTCTCVCADVWGPESVLSVFLSHSPPNYFLKIYFYLCTCLCIRVCVYVYCICASTLGCQKRALDSLEQELQVVVSFPTGVLGTHSLLLSRISSPFMLLF